MADACVDEHDRFLHYGVIWTAELHLRRPGAVGGAASPIGAVATELGFVAVYTDAVVIFEVDGSLRFPHSDASFPFLLYQSLGLFIAGSHHAQANLFRHFTAAITIRHPVRVSHAARLRAGAPFCGLLDAVGAHIDSQSGLRSVGSHGDTSKRHFLLRLAHPLLAAFSGEGYFSWEGAVGPGQL